MACSSQLWLMSGEFGKWLLAVLPALFAGLDLWVAKLRKHFRVTRCGRRASYLFDLSIVDESIKGCITSVCVDFMGTFTLISHVQR